MSKSPFLPRIFHTLTVGGTAVGVYAFTHNEVVTGIVTSLVSAGAGELFSRIRPRARRKRKLAPHVLEQLERLQLATNGDIHDTVNLLAAFRGQMALTIDSLRRVLDELQAAEDDPGAI